MRRAGGSSLSYADLCSGIMQQIDDHRKSTKFLLKQILNDVSKGSQKSGNMAHAYHTLKQTYTTTKQELSNVRLQADRTIADLQNRLKSRDAANNQMQLTIKQYEARASSSSSSHLHIMPTGISDGRMSADRHEHLPPPMQQYAVQKAAKERAQHNPYSTQRVLGQSRPHSEMSLNGPPLGPLQRSHSHTGHYHQSNVTPIQLGHRPLSASNSAGSGHGPLRHLSSSSNFVFSAKAQQSQHVGHINKRRRSATPTSIFGEGSSLNQAASPRSAFVSNSYNTRGHSQFSSTGFSRPH